MFNKRKHERERLVVEFYNISPEDKKFARELVKKYGQNSISYLALEDDKMLFFGKNADGIVAFGIIGHVVVVCGDPICAPKDFSVLLNDFHDFCHEHSYQCTFLGVTAAFIKEYEAMGYKHVKAGDEAIFELKEYNLSGGKMQKMRANVNHANKAGLTTHEYKPNDGRDSDIEQGILAVSEEWLADKKSGQLGFSVGGVGLENPLDRRYFYVTDNADKIVAFNVYIPFAGMNGYLADVTRRLHNAPSGATEKINFDAFTVFNEEGVKWGSLGLSPLANVHEEGVKDSLATKLLELIYEKCNGFYGFKDLHHAKEKYTPTSWIPIYIVYSTKIITPEIAYAIIKIQNQGGLSDFLLSNIKERLHGHIKK